MAQSLSSVWALYENHPEQHGKLIGLFSHVDLARRCALIQPLLHGKWHYRDIGNGCVIWSAQAVDPLNGSSEYFHFSVEEITVDRLVQSPTPED